MSRPTAPPLRLTAHSTSIVCADTDLRGDITIGPGVVIHPKSSILAVGGPIVIGKDCVVEELSVIVNRQKETMRIGENNHFMVGCRIESPSIGDNNTFQPRCKTSTSVVITDNCVLSANTTLLPSSAPSSIRLDEGLDTGTDEAQIPTETLPPYTVIYGGNNERRKWDGSGLQAEMNLRSKHIEYLREVVPKFNRLRPT